jgi:hypothetical protein
LFVFSPNKGELKHCIFVVGVVIETQKWKNQNFIVVFIIDEKKGVSEYVGRTKHKEKYVPDDFIVHMNGGGCGWLPVEPIKEGKGMVVPIPETTPVEGGGGGVGAIGTTPTPTCGIGTETGSDGGVAVGGTKTPEGRAMEPLTGTDTTGDVVVNGLVANTTLGGGGETGIAGIP